MKIWAGSLGLLALVACGVPMAVRQSPVSNNFLLLIAAGSPYLIVASATLAPKPR